MTRHSLESHSPKPSILLCFLSLITIAVGVFQCKQLSYQPQSSTQDKTVGKAFPEQTGVYSQPRYAFDDYAVVPTEPTQDM